MATQTAIGAIPPSRLPDEPFPAETRTKKFFHDFIAGSVGGAAQVIVGQPMDTIKTRIQLANTGIYKGPIDCLIKMIRNEGLLSLYKGVTPPLIGIGAVNSLLFAAYSFFKRIISPYPDLSLSEIAISGGAAGAVCAILASPVELFKIRLQAQITTSDGKSPQRMTSIISDIYRNYGFKSGIMCGFWVTVVREIPAYAAFYVGFEATKRQFMKNYPKKSDPPVSTLLISGAVGGCAYWLACYPLDVVKSRIQNTKEPPKGFWYIPKTFAAIYRQDGLKAFARGFSPTIIRCIPSAGATFTAYELTMRLLEGS